VGYLEALRVEERARFAFAPVASGVISWNALATEGAVEFRILRRDAPASPWLEYARWNERGRTSLSAAAPGVRVETDVIRADAAFDGIEIRGIGISFALVAFSSPPLPRSGMPYARDAMVLDVPARSQFVREGERGWCSPTSLSMLHAYHGLDYSVEATAREVFDDAYGGTGNWAFNVAFSGRLGLHGVVAYLDGLERAQRLIERSLPIAISYSWKGDELPGAPLDHSDGHLVVLCGFTGNGDCVVNDPAHPRLRAVYPRIAIERIWQRGGGVAYVVAPNGLTYADVLA